MSDLFITILNMSITASYVALIVIAIRYVLEKCRVPKIFSYVLWLVVLIRLVVPVSFESVFSLVPGKANVISQQTADSEITSAGAETRLIEHSAAGPSSQLQPFEAAASKNLEHILLEAGTVIWFVGVVVLLIYSLISYVRLKRRLTFATKRQENIYETDQIQTPFVLGFMKPRIYLPIGLAEQETDYILKHEQTHIRRFDHFIKPAAFFVLVLHWFNPIMWLSYVLMIKDMEMSCDEKVIQQMKGDARINYSRTLFALASKQSKLLAPISFGESHVKSRIKNILRYKQPAFWVGLLAALLLLAVSFSLLLNPQSNDQHTADEQEVIALVERFGDKLKTVMLSDPQEIVVNSMQNEYSEYVSQHAIDTWAEDLEQAPGRYHSSPWPEKIELLNVKRLADDAYDVEGRIVEITGDSSIAATRSIMLEVRRLHGEWRIDNSILGEYDVEIEQPDADTSILDSDEKNDHLSHFSTAGYISIDGDTLYVDEVEVITTEYADQMTGLQLHDPDRMSELNLKESDLPNGYYIHNPSTETIALHLTEQTEYTFTDVELRFVKDADGDRRYTTTEKEETPFTGQVSYPVFIEVQNDKVVSVTEIYLFTQ